MIKKSVNNFKNIKVMVLGDLMIDKYIFGDVERVSQEAPVPVIKVKREDWRLGGAVNVAHNIISLGGKVFLSGLVGKDREGNVLLDKAKNLGIDCAGVIIDETRPTIKKTRVIGINQQLLRLDYEKTEEIGKNGKDKILNWSKKIIKLVDIVVISDYAKGCLTLDLTQKIIKMANDAGKKVIVDPKPQHKKYFKGAYLLTPNEHEAISMTENKLMETNKTGRSLMKQTGANILITRGAKGMSLFEKSGMIINIPTEAREVYDVTGAGDTVTAVLALGIASGWNLENAVKLANKAAGIIVGKFGTAVLSPKELLNDNADSEETKIKTLKELAEILTKLKQEKKKIVFTNGCFDILHAGHIDYLQKAKKLGDILIIGLNSDTSVRELKGKNRPINRQNDRAIMLAALSCTDYIVIFDEKVPLNLVKIIKPDIYVKAADYKISDLPEAKIVKKYQGEVRLIPLKEGLSTSTIIKQIKEF